MENIPHVLWPRVCRCSEGFRGEAQNRGLQLEPHLKDWAHPPCSGCGGVVHKQQQQLPHGDTKWNMETCYKIKLSHTEGWTLTFWQHLGITTTKKLETDTFSPVHAVFYPFYTVFLHFSSRVSFILHFVRASTWGKNPKPLNRGKTQLQCHKNRLVQHLKLFQHLASKFAC